MNIEDLDKISFHTNQTPEQIQELEEMRDYITENINKDPKRLLETIINYKAVSINYFNLNHLSESLYFIGFCNYLLGKNDIALTSCINALKISKSIELKYRINICLGAIYTYFGDFSRALESYNIAINTPSKSLSPFVFNNIAAIYFKQKEYVIAIEYLNKAIELLEGNNDLLIAILNNIGRAYIELKDLENADIILLKAEELIETSENSTQEMINILNIGLLKYKQEKFAEAYDKLLNAYLKCKELDLKNNLYSATLFLAHACSKNNLQNQANTYYLETLELVKDLDKRLYNSALKDYIDFLVEQGDAERAINYFIEFDKIKDEIIAEDKEAEINSLTVKFQNTEQKLEIEKLNREKEFQQTLLAQAEEVKKTNEKLVEINQNLSDFSNALSHDIRTPIRQLAGFSSMIKNKNYEGKEDLLKQDLNYIYEAAKKADTMIQELHKFSITGIQEDQFREVDCNEVIKDALGNLAHHIAESNAEIEIKAVLPVLKGDKRLFTQLFQNLIGNAIKYSQKNTIPKIEINYSNLDDKKVISVKDNGIGVPIEEQKDVFKLFSRASNRGDVEGTGIGLSFCQKIISKMNGTIHLASNGLNTGTTVFLNF